MTSPVGLIRSLRHCVLPVAFLNCVTIVSGQAVAQPGAGAAAGGPDYRVSGPYVHDNLAVYLIHSEQRDDRQFMTLDEGLRKNLIVVTEKQNAQVNELVIENRSKLPCFIQEGDRLVGGKQDRTIYASLVIKPQSGQVPLPSFCIEQGRWQAGAGGLFFDGAPGRALSPKSVRKAAKIKKSQAEVWKEVARTKRGYKRAFDAEMLTSSLNEAQDSAKARLVGEQYEKTLSLLPANRRDTVGAAFAVNGKIEEANIYPGHTLFAKVYVRLLQSYAMEAAVQRALRETNNKRSPTADKPPTPQQVLHFIRNSAGRSVRKERVTTDNWLEVDDLGDRDRAVTRYRDRKVHEQYLAD